MNDTAIDTDLPLSEIMEFDSPIEVREDGTMIHRHDIYAPDLWEGEVEGYEWTLMNGYSGQDRYSGPVMHNSEYIGGRMERDIRETPGVYVVVACYWSPEEDDPDGEVDVEGWAVARLDNPVKV